MLDVAGWLVRQDAAWERRRPELVARKRRLMAEGVGPFLRGTAPLFFVRLREELARLDRRPALDGLRRWLAGDARAGEGRLAWSAGDVHAENFGAYRGADGPVRFGLNDFDDALVAPIAVDVVRLLASFLTAARAGGARGSAAAAVARRLVDAYAAELARPGARPDPDEAELRDSAVADLLRTAEESTRRAFLDKRAPRRGRRRAFVASERYRPVRGRERRQVEAAFERALATLEGNEDPPGYFEVVDVAERVAGLGSLGAGRYAVLVQGKGAEALLELKEARAPALVRSAGGSSRRRASRAGKGEGPRVVAGQRALRGPSPHLGHTTLDRAPFYLRRLDHREQRVYLGALGSEAAVLRGLADVEGLALARAHARSRVALGEPPLAPVRDDERAAWLGLAARLSGLVEADYLAFCLQLPHS